VNGGTQLTKLVQCMERAYRNLGYVLLTLLPIFIAGFWIPYLSEFPSFDASITTAVHVHAALLFCFLCLLIVQPLAIRYKAYSTHRILGKLSNFLMPLILVFSAAMLWKEYQEHLASGATVAAARNAEFLSAAQLVLLATLYSLAIARIRRRYVSAHMRYMICIALVLLPAGLARTLGYWFYVRQSSSQAVCLVLIDAFLIALIVFDRRRKLTARPYTVVLLTYVVIEACWVHLGRPV
jgi:hypothetical protein